MLKARLCVSTFQLLESASLSKPLISNTNLHPYFAGMSGIELPETEVFESERQNFRMRAEFRVWHEDDRSFFAMFDSDSPKDPVEVRGGAG